MIKLENWSGFRDFPIAGHYLEIIQNVNPLSIVGYAADGRVLFREDNVAAGFYIDRRGFVLGPDGRIAAPDPFVRFEITTQGAENVTFFVTDATGGNKSVSADVSDRAARLLGITYGNLGQIDQIALGGRNLQTVQAWGDLGKLVQALIGGVNALQVTERGFTYGASFKSTSALANNATEQVFAAATNVNGCILWAGDLFSALGGAGVACIGLHAHTAAPAAFTDGDVVLKVVSDFATAAGELGRENDLKRAVLIPAGKGLWFLNSGGTAEAAARRNLLYTLL